MHYRPDDFIAAGPNCQTIGRLDKPRPAGVPDPKRPSTEWKTYLDPTDIAHVNKYYR